MAFQRYYQRCILVSHSQGYLEARIDSIVFDGANHFAYGFRGESYQWNDIIFDSLSKDWLTKMYVNPLQYIGKTIHPNDLMLLSNKTLQYLDNNGHPFAGITIKSTTIHNNNVSAQVSIDPGPYITLDTLYIKGDARVSQKFITSYLGFVKGNPYSEKQILNFDPKLRSLGFISVIRPSEVEFIPGKARIYTYITNQRSSRFSGLVGFQTDDERTGLKLTGDVNLMLNNAFRNGERNIIKWQAPGEGTQRLNISTLWPYLLGSNFGINAKFLLYRRDTSYININPEFMVDFYFPNGTSIGGGFEFRSSSTLTERGNSTFGDFNLSLYRLSFSSGLISSETFPVKDVWFNTFLSIGSRITSSNSDPILKEKQSVGEVKGILSVYHPLYNELIVIHFLSQAQTIFQIKPFDSQIRFMENELFRIGGYQLLRGFNQESILADGYAITSAEVQFRLQKTINIILFYDKGLVSSYTLSQKALSWPYGFGFGFQLATKAGILNLNYALGYGFGQTLTMREAKVHVGYTASF